MEAHMESAAAAAAAATGPSWPMNLGLLRAGPAAPKVAALMAVVTTADATAVAGCVRLAEF